MSDLPRLLLCCFDVIPAPTAISRRTTEYIKGLSDRYQVVVLTVKTPDHTHIERYQGARLLRVPVGSGDLAARVQAFDRAVRRQLDSEEYVMVHFFDPFGGYALCERRSEFGYKLVYDACSLPSVDLPFLVSEAEANRRFIAKVRRQELFCLMNADVVIVANELTRDFVASLGVPREQVQVLPAPVDLGPYDPKVMGVPDATPMKLLHLGNQSDAQDLSTLLEAMQLALQTVDVRLTLVGPKDETHQARLEEQVAALKLTGKVDFQPQVSHDDLHKVLAAADVGLLTLSDVERNSRVGSPLSRLGEYLAAGRPVIAADVAAARALLPDDGVVLYRPQDKHSLADAIVGLATEPNRRVKLGAAARAASLDRDAAKIRADLVAIYVTLSGTGVRAVGDADTTTPDEVTQLGASLGSEDTQKRKAARAAAKAAQGEAPSGTNKVKTDPAMVAEDTSPEATAGADRPSVMGVPLHDEEPPVVLGEDVREVAAEFASISTEPNARRATEPPVVMGMPLAERPSAQEKPAENPLDGVWETPPKKKPGSFTPGDLAAELGEVPPSAPGLEAPTSPVPDEPRHLDDAPTTGSHLSLVPPSPPAPAIMDDEPMPTVPTRPPAPDEPPASPPPPRPPPSSPQVFIPPLEMPAPPVSSFPSSVSRPPFSSSPSGSSTPPFSSSPSGSSTPPSSSSPPASSPPPFSSPLSELTTPPPFSSSPSGSSLPPFSNSAPGSNAPPFSSSPSGLTTPPPFSSSPSGSSPPPFSSSSSGLTTPPPLPRAPTPAPAPSTGVPLMTVPPLPPRTNTSGQFAVIPGPPQLPRSTSGTFATVQPGQVAPRSGSSGQFAALAPSGPPPLTRTSGQFPSLSAPKTSTSGQFPTLPAPAPAPLHRSTKEATGLFPDAPKVPGAAGRDRAEEINESEIQQVSEGDGPLEVGADEIVEVPETQPEPPPGDESPLMASEESVTTVDTDASPPPSAIDPWLAQLVHGYCPPESGLFERHTPPTTMPGRDT